MDKIYTNMDEVRKKYFPEMVTVLMSKKEKDWWKRNNPFANRYTKR